MKGGGGGGGGGGLSLNCVHEHIAFFGMPHTIYSSSVTCLCVLKTMNNLYCKSQSAINSRTEGGGGGGGEGGSDPLTPPPPKSATGNPHPTPNAKIIPTPMFE